jgi:SOS-response transcriptional repressor LexA
MHKSTTELVYEFIRDYTQREGIAPSLRDIAEGCYLSHSTARYQLLRLEACGWILVLPGKARGIVLLERTEKPPRPADDPEAEKRESQQPRRDSSR